MSAPPPSSGEKARSQAHYEDMDRSIQAAPGSPSVLVDPASGAPSPPSFTNPIMVTGTFQTQRPSPPYSEPASVAPADKFQEYRDYQQQQQQQQHQRNSSGVMAVEQYPGLPKLDYRLYSPPLFELLPDATGIKSTASYLSTSATALVSLIRAQATVPPKPTIFIRGNRGRKVDFEVRCNLMSLLVPEDPAMRLDYTRCVGQGEMALRGGVKPDTIPHAADLESWARVFIEDQGHTKLFVLERQVANLDIDWLEGQIRNMVAMTNYKGVVTVKFPVLHSRVIVQSPDRVNKFFTSVSTLFTGKNTYEVVKAVWPFATHRNGEIGRQCVVQSEETWWREWKDPIKYAIASKRTGWVTNEDKLEAIMEGKGKGVAAVDWGPELDGST